MTTVPPGGFVQVGCAGRWEPQRLCIVAAAACDKGHDVVHLPREHPEAAPIRALAIAAVSGLLLALRFDLTRVQLLLPGPLELATRIRSNQPVAELDAWWNDHLHAAHRRLDQLHVINTVPGAPQPWQRVAEAMCDAMLTPPTVRGAHLNGQARS